MNLLQSYIIHNIYIYIYIYITSIHGHVSIHFICSNSIELQEMQSIAGILIGVLLYVYVLDTHVYGHTKKKLLMFTPCSMFQCTYLG